MVFNVSSNSIWIGYEISDTIDLPENLELVPIKVFTTSVSKKLIFYNLFYVNSSYFSGYRLETVTVVKDKVTNQKRFIILD